MSAHGPVSAAARSASFAAAIALILLVAALVVPTLATAPHQGNSDDGYYVRYMGEIAARGLGALPEQFRWYLAGQEHWIFPPPSRVGFSVISALWSFGFGASLEGLSKLSLASHLALIAVQFLFARRHFGELKAVLIAALTAFAPLGLGLSRLALTDSFISLCQVSSLWLFWEVVRAPERWSWRIAFVAVFTLALLTKEISVLLVLPFTALALIERFHRRRPLSAPLFASLLALPPLLTCVVWIAAAGGWTPLRETMRIVMGSPATNEYAINFGSGAWYRYPLDELLASPWPTLLGLAGVALVFWRWRHGEYDALRLHFALIYVLEVAALSPFTKNLRYVAVLEAPLRVLGVLLICDLVAWKRAAWSRTAAIALVALLCFLDWQHFERLFIQWRIYDPVTLMLCAARKILFLTGGPQE